MSPGDPIAKHCYDPQAGKPPAFLRLHVQCGYGKTLWCESLTDSGNPDRLAGIVSASFPIAIF